MTTCRLCGAPTERMFSLRVLEKHDVAYLRCNSCASLQTELPYWITEAYTSHLAALDVGAAQRALTNVAAVYTVCRALGLRDVLDFGGGDGLLCRLLRDHQINCFVVDKYAAPTYCREFTQPNFATPDLLLAFEVLEHLENPRTDVTALFAAQPRAILASTTVYSGQGPDWWYLTPETGQHVFFYSRQALQQIARLNGYAVLIHGYYIFFVRGSGIAFWKRLLLSVGLSRLVLRMTGALLRLSPTRGVTADFNSLRSKARRQ